MTFSEAALCIEILGLSDQEPVIDETLDEFDREIFDELAFQPLNKETLIQIHQGMSNPLDVIEFLSKVPISFQFYPDAIQYLTNSQTFYKKMPKFTLNTILRSYVAWTFIFSKTNDTEYFQIVLNSLNFFTERKISDEYSHLRLLGIYAFYFSVNRYISLSKNPNLEAYILQIVDFFVINESIPPQIYKLFENVVALLLLSQNYNEQLIFNILSTISSKIRSKKENVPSSVLENILQQLVRFLLSFNSKVLQFWAQTSLVLDDFQLANFFPQIVEGLLSNVNSSTIKLNYKISPSTEGRIELKPIQNDYYIYYQNQMFQNSSEITDYITFPEHQSLLNCISPSLLNSLAIIEEIYLRSQVLSQKFIEVYAKKLPTYFDKDNALEQITMFTYVCVVIFQSFPVYINPQALWNNIIFSGHYTAFNPSETYLFLNNFRQLYIRFLIEPQKCTCSYFFKRAAEYPLIFAEMVHRLIQYSLHKYIDPAKAAQITVGLMNPLIQYRDMEYTEPIIKARKAVITFLLRCFRQKETAYAFFVNKDFLRKAFCLFFESALVKGTSSIFFNYINSSQKIENITEIVEIINEFVLNVFQKMPTSEGLKLLVQFLKELNDSLMYKPQYVNNFISLIELLCKKVITLGDDVDREDILIQVISLMAVTSHEHSIKIRELTAIEAAILKLNNNNPKNDIMIKLAQIIAKRPLSFVLPNFDIQQPNVLILFLRIYLKSEKLMDVINFLINLCDFSPENCTKCHDGDLDIFIIDVIDQWRINGGISNEIVNRMLDLLLKIILVTASVSVMQKFFSLFCPINGQNLPYYFSDIISTFNRALISVNKSPLAYIMVDSNSSAKIHGVNADNLNNGLTFSFWFYPIQNDVVTWKQYLFICQDSNGHCLKLILQNKTLIVRLQKGYDHYKGTFELHYTNLMWQLISVSYRIGTDEEVGCNFTLFINGKMSKRLNRFPAIEFKNPLNILINECSKNRPIMEKPCRIGQIILTSELNLNEMQTIVDDGPRGLQTMPLSLIFAIEGVENNGYFGFVNKFTKGITIESKLKNVREDTRFALILVNMVKIENIIPLFALIDLTSPQNEKVPFLLENFIDILKNILLLGQMAQNYFVEANGFSIISHLLTKSDTSNLTYKIYLRFYDLLQVITRTSLQKQLYDEILLNMNLWILATPKNHLMILRHWARIISDENLITEIKSFRYFLYVLKKFYYFKPSDDSFIVKERPQNLSIDDCRRSIYEVLTFYISQQKFDDFDFKAIVFNAMISGEEESLSLLSYLSNLVFSHETPSYFYEICFNNLKLLYKFIEESHDAKVLLTINVISEIFKRIPDKRDKLKLTVIECMKLLDVNVISQSFFTQILSLTNGGFPEFLPLVIWSTINCGKSIAMDLIKTLKPNPFYKTDLTSLFWSIILLYFVEKSDRQTVISFLLQLFNDNWKDLFFTLQAVGIGFKVKKIMEELRFLFVKIILEKLNDKNLNDIFVITSHFILFHHQSSHFISSEFDNQKVFAAKSKKRDVISFIKPKNEEEILENYFRDTNVKKLISLTNISNFIDENKTLSLNINNKNQWRDEDFAKRLLQILLNNPKQEFVDFILILSYFMRKNQLKNSNCTFLTPLDSIQPFLESKEELQFSAALIDPKSDITALYPLFDYFCDKIQNSEFVNIGNVVVMNVYQTVFMFEGPAVLHQKTDQLSEIFWPELSLFDESFKKDVSKRRKNWLKLWRNVTMDSAPWNNSLPIELRKVVRYKRDNKICSFFCPMKLRQNFAFNDHMEASLTRDSGNVKLAKQKAIKIREEQLRTAHSSSSFLSITGEVDDNNETADDSSHKKCQNDFDEIKSRVLCKLISVKKETLAALIVRDNTFKIFCQNGKTIIIHFNDIKAIFQRTFRHEKNSLEIFTIDGDDYFIRFKENFQYENILSLITMNVNKFPPKSIIQNLPFKGFWENSGLTEKWVNHEISTFEYLMSLNIYSGRSFLVPSQYPLFPWILTDFSSPELDLNNPNVYRDLSKPVGALTERRLDEILKRYEEMKNIGMKPYFYGNGPVFPLSVFQYLIRMEPFTSMHIQIQGGRFDHAARLFTKISDTSRQIREQDGDFRELIPEFFFMTEFLENTNGFDLGKTDKNQLGDVILPEWSHENKFEFIYKHRKALESPFVSENINKWIDLIWGVKQKSLEDNNVYKQEMYPNYQTQSSPTRKAKDKIELRSFLDHMGQIPPQIFDNLHPMRKPLKPKPTLITQMLIKDHLDQLVSANIEIINEECYLRFLTIQNEFCELIYDLNQLQTDGCSSPKSFIQQKICELMLDDPLPVVFGRKLIYCAENQQNKINLTKFENQTLSSMEIPSRITTMTLDDNYIICAGEDSKVYISKIDSKKKGATISFRGEVTCIGFSSCFDLLVGATTDSALIFWSLSRQTNARIVELNQITVLSIVVTPSFGFVLVHARMAVGGVLKYSLILFSVNGEKIREIETKHLVILYPWSSRDGFDYVLCADTTGNIYNFEAFWLNFPKEPIAHCGDTVLSIGMTKLAPAAIAVTNAGKIFAFHVKI